MSDVTEAVIDRLVLRFDSLKPIFREHLADNFGEVLPHLFMGEVTRYLHEQMIAAEQGNQEDSWTEVDDVLTVLEHEFSSGGSEVEELIAVSFLENLMADDKPGREISSRLGPVLRAELMKMRAWKPPQDQK